jgi:hypothetical protein
MRGRSPGNGRALRTQASRQAAAFSRDLDTLLIFTVVEDTLELTIRCVTFPAFFSFFDRSVSLPLRNHDVRITFPWPRPFPRP